MVKQTTFDRETKDAWDAYIQVHGGERPARRPRRSPTRSSHTSDEWAALSDAERLATYLEFVKERDERFKHDVTYQLYSLTELAIWLYKRLPLGVLALTPEERDRGDNGRKIPAVEREFRKEVEKLLRWSNDIEGEPKVPRFQLSGQSHEPPPPPPGWPPQP